MRGFDTRIGLLHGLRYGRESLVLDMVEEFRAAMVDRFVLKRINSSGIETACGRGTRRACARGAKPLPDIQRD